MFYDNYLRLCNSVGKSPSAVALEIGIEKSTVTRWKQGKSQTDANIRKVADYFGVPVSELTGEKEKAPTQEGERKVSDDDIKFALWGTREIDDDVLDRVKQFAKFAQENEKNK